MQLQSHLQRAFVLLFLTSSFLFAQTPMSEQAAPLERNSPTSPASRTITTTTTSNASTPCVITVMATITDLTCGGDGSGMVVLSSPDWTLPLMNVDWDDDTYDGMTSVTGIPAGTYMVTVTDDNNCTVSITFTVNEPPPLEVTMCVADNFDEGSGLGFIQFFAGGGTGNYDLSLIGPTTINDNDSPGAPNNPNTTYFVNITTCVLPGDYTIMVTDENGCTASCGPITFNPNCIINASAVVTQPDCLGGGGDIQVTANSAYCNTNYSWTGGLAGDHPVNIPDGTYSVTVSDFYGCEVVLGPYTIATPMPPMLTCTGIATTGPSSNDGRIELVINDGTAPFDISWSGPNNGNINTSSNSPTIPGLPTGDYTITVIDALGCESTCMVTVELPPCNLSISCAAVDPTMAGANGGIDISILSGFQPYNVFYFGPNNGSSGGEAGPVINLTDLPPGAYNVQVTDALNCTESCMVFITGIDCSSFSVDTSSSVATCGSANSGAIDLNPMGGMGPYTFDWTLDSLDGIEDPINLPSGMYSVVVSDAQGCSVGPLDFDLQTDPPLVLSCSPADATTNGGMDGSITIDLSGGLAPYGLLWTTAMDSDSIANVSDGFVLNNLVAGDYTLLITDQNGCTISCMATVGEPTCTLSFTGMFTDPVCAGDSSGSISLDIMNVTGMLTVDWDDDQYDGMTDLMLLPAGSYTVSVSDESGCTPAPQTFVLTDPAPLSLTCFGNQIDEPALGVDSLVVEVANGTAPYSVTYTGPMSDTQTGLMGDSIVLLVPEGDYSVVVTDANGCVDSCMATILPPSCVDLGFTLAATNNLCAADSNGTITLTMTGGFDPFTFSWSDPTLDGMQSPTGLAAGWYIVTVTDIANCMLVDSIEVLAPAPIDLNCAATDESTSGGLDGMIDVSFGGGMAPYDISGDLTAAGLMAADSPFNFNSLAPGIYNLVITDANGCQDSCSAVVNPGGCLINLDFSLVQPSCGMPNGSATVTVNDADAPFTFDWDDDSLDGLSMVTDLAPGDYGLTVTDNLGCIVDSSFTIIPFTDFPSVNITPPIPGCYEDCISYDLSFSGTGPFELSYDFDVPGFGPGSDLLMVPGNMGQLQLCPIDFGVESLEGMSIDFVRVTDAVCFRDTSVVALPQVLPQPADTLRGLACADSVLNINGTIFDAATPMGEVVLTDASANGCDSVVVVDLTFLPVPMGTLDTTVCEDQSVTVGAEVFDIGRPMGSAILPDASVNGCDSTVMVTVSFFDPVPGTLDTTICRGDSFDFNGELFDEMRTMGDVVLPGATINGCDSTVMVTVSFFDPVPGTLDTTICSGTSFDFNGEIFDEMRTMGDVILPGATVNGCDSTVMVTVSFFPVATGSLDSTLCVGESLSVGSEDFDVTRPAGQAVLTAAAANGCDSTVMVTLSFFPAATGELDSLLCPGEFVEVNGEVFDESRRQGDVLLPGASVNGCDSTVSVNLSYRMPAAITLSGQGRICTGEMLSINLDNSGSETYNVLLDGVPGPALAVAPGSNSFELDVADGTTLTIASVEQGTAACAPTFSGSITVERSNLVLDLQSLSGSPGFDLSCFDSADGILEVTATGGVEPYTYTWSNGGAGPRLVDLPAGTVGLTVTDAIGCNQEISYELLAPPALNMEVVGGMASCIDNLGQAQIQRIGGGSEPYLYQVNGGVFLPLDSFPQLINQLPGDYSITIQDANGCELSDAFTISPAPESQLFIQPEEAIVQLGDSILLNAQTDATVDSLFWSAAGILVPNANDLQVWAGPLESTVYSVWLRDLTGCELEAEVLVQVDRNVPIFQPSAFSPNGDGVNDVFLLYFGDGVAQLEDFQVFNRWGDIVHQVGGILDLSNTSWSWDGRQGGQTLNPGVFVYSVRVTYLDGRQEIVAGEVTLVR